jgi:Protein of unknown function (DUF3014)
MADFDELKLDKSAAPPPPPQPRWILIIALAVLLVAAVALWFYFRSPPDVAENVQPNAVVTRTLEPAAKAPAELPPLDASDAMVRDLVRALSQHPTVASLLTTDQLIRTFAVSIRNIAEGDTPSRHLKTIQPGGALKTERRGNRTYIDPASYARFDPHAAAVQGIDPAGAAQVYRTLKPRLEEAYREVAGPEANFERAFAQAIARLLATPVVEGPIAVKPTVAGYAYADPALESLPRAQQQLLRMGPANVRIVQEKLRAIAREIGVTPQ